MFVFSVIVLTLALATTHAHVILPKAFNRTARVVNGYDATHSQFPYIVLLHINLAPDNEPISCGGALIGNTWVLTAAHCVHSASKVAVYLGLTFTDYAEALYNIKIDNIKIHPDYDSELDRNDIALIQIPHSESCDAIKTLPLPAIASTYPDYVLRFTLFSGWGQTKAVPLSPLLQWVRLPVMPNSVCCEQMQDVTSDKLCVDTGNDHRSPCVGDSGGPLVLQSTGELIGVLSTISDYGCDLGYPVVFTRVTSYLEWIKSISGISY